MTTGLSLRALECDDVEFGALARALLDSGLILRFRAGGISMRPLIRNRDLLYVKRVQAEEVHVGDLVLFMREAEKVVVHRVLRKRRPDGNHSFLIKGDRVPCADGEIPYAAILGKVIARERNGTRSDLLRGEARMLGQIAAWVSVARGWLFEGMRRLRRTPVSGETFGQG